MPGIVSPEVCKTPLLNSQKNTTCHAREDLQPLEVPRNRIYLNRQDLRSFVALERGLKVWVCLI